MIDILKIRREACKQTSRQADKQTSRQADKQTSRQADVDIFKIIACILILLRHQYHLGLPDGSFPFSTAWIFVEFFFAISGYFTIVHFRKNQKIDDIDLSAKEAIIYAEKKWIRFLPYTFISVYMKCTMNYLNEGHGLSRFIIAFLEGSLLIRGESNNGVLWYLSAILIVLPLFCFFVQILPKYVSLIFAILGCIIYYDNNVLDCFFQCI